MSPSVARLSLLRGPSPGCEAGRPGTAQLWLRLRVSQLTQIPGTDPGSGSGARHSLASLVLLRPTVCQFGCILCKKESRAKNENRVALLIIFLF